MALSDNVTTPYVYATSMVYSIHHFAYILH